MVKNEVKFIFKILISFNQFIYYDLSPIVYQFNIFILLSITFHLKYFIERLHLHNFTVFKMISFKNTLKYQ